MREAIEEALINNLPSTTTCDYCEREGELDYDLDKLIDEILKAVFSELEIDETKEVASTDNIITELQALLGKGLYPNAVPGVKEIIRRNNGKKYLEREHQFRNGSNTSEALLSNR